MKGSINKLEIVWDTRYRNNEKFYLYKKNVMGTIKSLL